MALVGRVLSEIARFHQQLAIRRMIPQVRRGMIPLP